MSLRRRRIRAMSEAQLKGELLEIRATLAWGAIGHPAIRDPKLRAKSLKLIQHTRIDGFVLLHELRRRRRP